MKKRGEEIIRLEGATKYYHMGEVIVKAVDGIDISINKGDFVAVMGPSGSGKSTAMNLIGSLDMATKGHIFLDKEDISLLEESDLAQVRGKHIGFIFQQFNLIPTLTVKENIMLPMTLQNLDADEREERVQDLMKKMELQEREDHYPSQISGGQQQRVAIARSIANDPEVVLADEPTGNLDTKTGERVMDFLNKLNKEGKTIVMVTHDPDLAKKYADVVYWLVDGKVKKITRKKR
ncbi:ABC transporter ATP-binding protein [Candidatus Pacearchaeota archaeon]|nr:ABC transporter ATP-binding protein [Candidatus Pacearchaeota archaeon]